ncbi:MAG: TorF family putative porin [Planctomycetota bacterium]
MTRTFPLLVSWPIVVLGLAAAEGTAAAQDVAAPANNSALSSFSLSSQEGGGTEETGEPVAKTETTSVEEETPQSPFSLDLTYYLYSDYVFRGVNYSEYGTEGREKPNHQMTTDLTVDLGLLVGQEAGTYGTFCFGTFFEWYAAQKRLDPTHGGQNLQEVDYALSYTYEVEPIATTFTLGYNFYTLPNAKSGNTSEWSLLLEHNDAWMWKWLLPDNEDGILNPSFFFAQDVEAADGGSWIEFGLSHDFALFENFTLTPGVIFAIDHRYLDPVLGTGDGATQMAYIQYGLIASYDLAPLLHLPERMGAVTLSGFLYYNDAVGNLADHGRIEDELHGGMSIGWSF